jgi:serine/threonine protein kinase
MIEAASLLNRTLDEKYRIERQLSGGGMGTVFLATHVGTERPVAVKVIAPEYMTNAEFVERFRREAKAAGRLRHPNVVNVTDFGFAMQDGTPTAYLVMEYLDGCTLADVLTEEKRLSLAWTADIVEQMCLAIDAAHRAGIVHRDLKPENIWLEPNRRGGYTVKVLDFGLAKLRESCVGAAALPAMTPETFFAQTSGLVKTEAATVIQRRGGTNGKIDGGVTQTGTVLGTPLYMSPEQCRGEAADARSDVYAIGVIAYQMLTGVTPFEGDGATLLERHVSESPRPIRDVWKKIPRGVARVVMSALEKDPARRPQSARAFANAFRAHAEGFGALVRQSIILCSQHFKIFLQIVSIAFLPSMLIIFLITSIQIFGKPSSNFIKITLALFGILGGFASLFSQFILAGIFVPITAQLVVSPVVAIKIRPAFQLLKRRWRAFLVTFFWATIWQVGGFLLAFIPLLLFMYWFSLSLMVTMMESMQGREALRRSKLLVRRIPKTVVGALVFSISISILFGIFNALIKQNKIFQLKIINELKLENICDIIFLIFMIAVGCVTASMQSLVYFKARQAGGEMVSETLAEFEAENLPRTVWQTKMLARGGARQ